MLKRIFFYTLLVIIPAVSIFVADIFIGSYLEVDKEREASRMFRSEAVPLYLRTKSLSSNIDHRYRYGVREDPRYQGDPSAPRLFRTNNLGTVIGNNHDNNVSYDKSILFLGGSTTECNEVDEEFRFPRLVGEHLTKYTGVRYQGINLGVRGNTSRDSLNLLLNHPVSKTAETVVLMHNINDRLMLSLRGSYDTFIESPSPTGWPAVSSALHGFFEGLWDYISYRSNLLFLINKNVFGTNPWTGEGSIEGNVNEDSIEYENLNLNKSIDAFRSSLKTFVAVTRAMDKTPVLMTQALGRMSKLQVRFNQVVRQVSYETMAPLIDAEEYINSRGRGLFLSDDIHLNNEGSRVISQIVAEQLAAQVFDVDLSEVKTQSAIKSMALEDELSVCSSPEDGGIYKQIPSRHLLLKQTGRYPVVSSDNKWLLIQTMNDGKEVIEVFDNNKRHSKTISQKKETEGDRHATFFYDGGDDIQIIFARMKRGVERLYQTSIFEDMISPVSLPDNLSASIPATHGNSIFFAGNRVDLNGKHLGPPDLYHLQDGVLQQLTNTPWEEWRPVMDPSGESLFYISNKNGQFEISHLDVYNRKRSTFFDTESDEWDPSISPDGNWIVFASKASGSWNLMLSPNGAPDQVVQLTNSDVSDDWDPTFSPNGNAILFASSNRNAPPYIYFICPFGESGG